MSVLALIGLVSAMIASAVVMVLPLCLAIWVSCDWLWLYVGYMLFAALCVWFLTSLKPKEKGGDQ